MSEYDETQLFPDMRLARLLLERLGKNSLSVSIEVAALKIVEAQATIAEQGAEIARLNRLIDLADIPNSVGSLNPVFPKKRTPPMTDTALIERAKQTVKIIEGNYDRHVDLFSIDMQEFGVIHEMLEALEQSQWVSVSDNMPAIGEIVHVAGGRAYLDVNAAWWTVEESPPRKIQWNVTHWKPITPPPAEVET